MKKAIFYSIFYIVILTFATYLILNYFKLSYQANMFTFKFDKMIGITSSYLMNKIKMYIIAKLTLVCL